MSRMNPDTDFPTKLKYLRFYYDLSQAYIADSLNVNRLSYMAYENGKVQPSIEMLAAIASFFAVSTDSLLGLAPLEVASDTHAFYPRQVQDAPVCLFRYVLQLCRTRRHLTQLQLCGMLGLDTGAYAAYEIGEKEPEFKILVQLSRFFGVSVDYLLGAAPDEELKKAIEPFLGTYAFPSGGIPYPAEEKDGSPAAAARMDISRRLIDLRMSYPLSRREMAKALHLPLSQYTPYERSRQGRFQPPYQKVVDIAYLFGISVEALLGLSPQPIREKPLFHREALKSVLAEHIRSARQSNHFTQKYVAAMLNMNRSTYAYYERGTTTPSLTRLAAMSTLFHVPTDGLLGFASPASEPTRPPGRALNAPQPMLSVVLRDFRSRCGLTQQELSDILSLPSYRRYEESYFPTYENLVRIAHLYGVSTDCLLGIVEPEGSIAISPEAKAKAAWESIRLDFPARLRYLRQKNGLSPTEAAQAIGVATRTYRHYEWGSYRPSYPILIKIACLYGVRIDYLLGEEPLHEN